VAEYRRYSPTVERQMQVRPYRRRPGDPLKRPLRIFTLDPGAARIDASTTTVEVPWEPLGPGPEGALFYIDARDGDDDNAGVDLDDPRLLIAGGIEPSVSDHRFHQQMVYAVCSRVYAQFQYALGRVVSWGFDAADQHGRLCLRPHDRGCGANASYQKNAKRISFGYFENPGEGVGRTAPQGKIFTCLSHDVIAHEFTHALLDGLRSHFIIPTASDVLGFHEGFADIVAVFQHLLHRNVVEAQLRRVDGDLDQAEMLANIAEQFGTATQGRALRRAISKDVVKYRADMAPHEMGNVLLSAVFAAFLDVYRRRTQPYVRLAHRPPSGYLTAELVTFLAGKASDIAEHFLHMCIRAIDYCPPVDLHLGEYLRALVTVDRELVPDDPWNYRDALITAFAARGIYPTGVGQLTEDALVWRPPARVLEPVAALHFRNLRFAGDPSLPADAREAIRQAEELWAYASRPHVAAEFGLTEPGEDVDPCCVESIRTTRRGGPDGQVLFDLVAEITQRRRMKDPATGKESKFFGGSTVIIGPEGEIRYIISKSIDNAGRQQRQVEYQRQASDYWQAAGDKYTLLGYGNELAHRKRPTWEPGRS
jgi:hypothetical protein